MNAMLTVNNLAKQYSAVGLRGERRLLHAVDNVNFTLDAGRTLGIVGESGCGKSTTAKLALGPSRRSSGRIDLDGKPVSAVRDAEWRVMRRSMQMVYQDPLAALDSRLPVGDQVVEPLIIQDRRSDAARRERARLLRGRRSANRSLSALPA